MKRSICIIAACAALGGFLPAQGAAAPTELEPVVVTATRTERPVSEVPASVTVITAEEIAQSSAQTVPELLRGLTGISVSDWTGTGRSATVDLRGFGETAGSNTLVMVDGRRVNSPDMSGIDWTTIPLDRIERIEIVRGGGSVLYGNNAVGGTIHILTRHGGDRPTLTAEAAYGSYDASRYAAGFDGSAGNWSWHLDGSYRETDGYRDNGEFRNGTAGVGLSWESGRFGARLSAGYKDDRYGLPGALPEGAPRRSTLTPDYFAETRDRYVQVTPWVLLPGDGELSVALRRRSFDSQTEYGVFSWDFTIDEIGISPQLAQELTLLGLPHALVLGLDHQRAELENRGGGQDRERQETGVFVHDRIALRPWLHLTLGYRSTETRYDIDGADSESFRTDAATFGIVWNHAPGSRIFASVDRAFRTVLLDELGGVGFDEILRPQTSRHYQVGILQRLHERIDVGATLFRIDTRNEIFYDPYSTPPGGMWPGENLNYGRTLRDGVEVTAAVRLHRALSLAADYTYLDTELRGGAHDGNPIPGVARHSASVRMSIRPVEAVALDVRVRWIDGKSMISDWGNAVKDKWEGGDYVVTDLIASWNLGNLTLYGGINNLFDEEYSEHGVYSEWGSGIYPAAERNFIAGIRMSHSF